MALDAVPDSLIVQTRKPLRWGRPFVLPLVVALRRLWDRLLDNDEDDEEEEDLDLDLDLDLRLRRLLLPLLER